MYHLILKPRSLIEREERMEAERIRILEEQEITNIKMEREMKIRMEAERLRCNAINQACSSGRIIVNDPYYNNDNPYWLSLAKENLFGYDDYSDCGLSSPDENAKFVETSADFLGDYFSYTSDTKTRNNIYKTHRSSLKNQQRVNKQQNYSRFGK
jgi:hypothetical protein